MMKKLWREPLLHFLLLGAALFLIYAAVNRSAAGLDTQTIVVDRDKILTHLQYRSRAFDTESSNERIDKIPAKELQELIDGYVREEALYREAKALQLDRNDYVARRRLIQQLEFITRGFAETKIELNEDRIADYYETHKARFYVAPQVTFTHVFFNNERHGAERAAALARETLQVLNRKRVRFDQAPGYGDRFLYQVNYVAREPEEIASHFGATMQQALFALQPSERQWQGPYRSQYGSHLVLLTRNEPGYTPPLEEVRAKVEQEASQAALDELFEKSLQSIVKTYKVDVRRDEFAARP